MSDRLGIVLKLAQVGCDRSRNGIWRILGAQQRSDLLRAHREDGDETPQARAMRVAT